MVNQNGLFKISNFIEANRIRAMKKWTSRTRYNQNRTKSTHIKVLIKKIRSILGLISGDDLVEMLKGFLRMFLTIES
jgi:hypothetical protein